MEADLRSGCRWRPRWRSENLHNALQDVHNRGLVNIKSRFELDLDGGEFRDSSWFDDGVLVPESLKPKLGSAAFQSNRTGTRVLPS